MADVDSVVFGAVDNCVHSVDNCDVDKVDMWITLQMGHLAVENCFLYRRVCSSFICGKRINVLLY